MSTSKFNLRQPFPDIFPTSWWKDKENQQDFMGFRNLDHFLHVVSNLTQKKDDNCNMTYKVALDKLLRGVSDFPEEEQASIRNLVRSNLHKRGLITEEVYENYRYSVDGTAVGFDVGKYAAGEPDCVITPSQQYVDFFYELYISISYPHHTSNDKIRLNTAKLLATIEELERQHIFIKITLILPIRNISSDVGTDFFASVPLFSHKDQKSVNTMSAVVNDRLLRKFFFAILEDTYKDKLNSRYGYAVDVDGCMNIGHEFDEIVFFENIVNNVGS